MAGSVSGVNNSIFQDTTAATKAAVKDLGRDEFLKLLTIQLKEQNPLQPTSNTEFAAQLAQFSQLEQLSDIRTALDDQIKANLMLSQSITNVSAASLIGKSVKAYSNKAEFDGTNGVKIGYTLSADARKVTVEIRDSKGNLVRTLEPKIERKQGDNTITWDGKNGDGATLPSGNYTFSVKAKGKDDISLEADPYTYGTVDSVRFKSTGTVVVLNGREVALADITDITSE